MAWHPAGGSVGLGMGVGKAGTGGRRRKKTANKQQRKTQVKLDVGDGAVWGLELAMGFSKP